MHCPFDERPSIPLLYLRAAPLKRAATPLHLDRPHESQDFAADDEASPDRQFPSDRASSFSFSVAIAIDTYYTRYYAQYQSDGKTRTAFRLIRFSSFRPLLIINTI